MKTIAKKLSNANRPVLVLGAGARCAHLKLHKLLDLLHVPVCLTWGAADLLPESSPYRIGTFGTHGTRAANFAVQNADLLICIGTRLDTKATGTPAKWFAREAEIIMVDIDRAETDKMQKAGVTVEAIHTYADDFVNDLLDAGIKTECFAWLQRCQEWREKYPPGPGEAYRIMRQISDDAPDDCIIVSDTGCVLAWAMQSWRFKPKQRFLHPFNQTPMGYALPAAVGAYYATGKKVIVLTGDGSIMMNLGELATIAARNLPVKIFLFDNKGHAMCRQTQREWMGGTYPTTSIDGGLSFPDFHSLKQAFSVDMNVIEISPDEDVNPKAKFGFPNEDQYPHLPREEFLQNMIVRTVHA